MSIRRDNVKPKPAFGIAFPLSLLLLAMGSLCLAPWAAWLKLALLCFFSSCLILDIYRYRLRKNQIARLENERNLRMLYESMGDIVLVVTPEGRLLHANRMTHERLGYAAMELAAMHLLDLHPVHRRAEAEAILGAVLRGDQDRYAIPLVTKNGTLLPVEIRVWPGQWDETPCFFGICNRLTPEQEADQVIEAIFRDNPSPMALTTFPERRFVHVNDAFVMITGYPREEIINRTANELNLFDDLAMLTTINSRILAHGHISNEELRIRRKDGSLRDGLFSGTVIASLGRRYFLTVMQDITDRKRTEESLRQSEEAHRTLFREMLDGFALHEIICNEQGDPVDYRFLAINPAFEQMTGLKASDVLGRRVLDVLPSTEDFWIQIFGRVALTGESVRFEHYANSIGKHFDVSAFCPAPHQFACVIADITARKQAESESLINAQRTTCLLQFGQMTDSTLQEITDFALENIVALTRSKIGYLAFLNEDESILTMHSWSREAMRICSVMDKPLLYPVAKTGLWGEAVRQRKTIITNDYSKENPLKKGLPEGHVPLIRHMNVPIMNGRKMVLVAGVGNKASDYTEQDEQQITLVMQGMWRLIERKHSEEALRESEEKLSTLFNAMSEMVVLHEMIFNDEKKAVNYRILDCNRTFTALTGIERDAAIGRLATDVYRMPDAPYLAEYAQVVETGTPSHFQSYFAPFGKYFAISTVSLGKHRFATVTSDITAETKARHMIATKNKELEQIIYIASHDLRSPLVNLDGYGREMEYAMAEIIRISQAGTAADPLSTAVRNAVPEMKDALQHIHTSTKQMDALIKGLLKLSRSGRAALTIQTLDMNVLVANVVALFAFQIKGSGSEVRLENLPPCRGDEVQLTQVFSNLIGNALKFFAPGRTGVLSISGTVEHGQTIYCVEDNGIGIAAEHQEKIFELFYRLNPKMSDGEGLGLTIVRQILGRLDGEIRVESTVGEGSRFFVTLPSGQ